MADRWLVGNHAPSGANGFAFGRDVAEGDNLLSWSHDAMDEALRKVFRREILSVGTQISMKAPLCDGDFSS